MPKKKGNKKKSGKHGKQGEETVEILLQRGETCLVQFQFDEAAKLLARALSMRPADTTVMDTLAQAYMELGEQDKALELLQKSGELAPDVNFNKWLYLGQLSEGNEAVQNYQKGIDLMLVLLQQRSAASEGRDMTEAPEEEEEEELAAQVSNAYCSLAEIYMTDLCDEPVAERECERLMQLAVTSCPNNPEAHAAQANLLLVQGRQAEAKVCVERAIALYNQNLEGEGLGASYEPRTNCAKMCIELNMFTEAAELLENLLREDDRFVEIWYLVGLCYHRTKELDTAVQCLGRAQEMLQKSLGSSSSSNSVDDPGQELLAKISTELTQAVAAQSQQPKQPAGDIDDDSDEEMGG